MNFRDFYEIINISNRSHTISCKSQMCGVHNLRGLFLLAVSCRISALDCVSKKLVSIVPYNHQPSISYITDMLFLLDTRPIKSTRNATRRNASLFPYPLAIQHTYGKLPSILFFFVRNGHFQQLCQITRRYLVYRRFLPCLVGG